MAAAAGGPAQTGSQAPREQLHAPADDASSPDAWKASLKLPKKDERVKTEVSLGLLLLLQGNSHTFLNRMSRVRKATNLRTTF